MLKFFYNFDFSKIPVGALTSKAYAYTSRNWELETIQSVDIFDAFGSAINVGIRGSTPMRILPKVNEKLNEEWITDKVRLSYEGYSRQRLVSPLLRVDNLLIPCSWSTAFEAFSNNLTKRQHLVTVTGRLLDIESIVALRDFSLSMGHGWRFDSSSLYLDYNLREFYLCFLDFSNFELVDLLIVIGCDLKLESPILNLYIRRLVRSGSLVVETFGTSSPTSFSLGSDIFEVFKFLEGRHSLSVRYARANSPFILIGYSFLKHLPFSAFSIFRAFKVGIIHPFVGYVNALEIGFSVKVSEVINKQLPKSSVLFLSGVDEVSLVNDVVKSQTFVVYQGHNGSLGASFADLVLPSTSFLEKDGSFLNNFGLQQRAPFILTPPKDVRTDWRIFDALLFYLTKDSNTISPSRVFDFSHFKNQSNLNFFEFSGSFNKFSFLNNGQMQSSIFDYYRTDSLTQSSKTLLLASKNRSHTYTNYL